MHQGGAMHELDRRRGGIGRRGIVVPAGRGDGETEPGADAGAAREYRVAHGRGQQRRRCPCHRHVQATLTGFARSG